MPYKKEPEIIDKPIKLNYKLITIITIILLIFTLYIFILLLFISK